MSDIVGPRRDLIDQNNLRSESDRQATKFMRRLVEQTERAIKAERERDAAQQRVAVLEAALREIHQNVRGLSDQTPGISPNAAWYFGIVAGICSGALGRGGRVGGDGKDAV